MPARRPPGVGAVGLGAVLDDERAVRARRSRARPRGRRPGRRGGPGRSPACAGRTRRASDSGSIVADVSCRRRTGPAWRRRARSRRRSARRCCACGDHLVAGPDAERAQRQLDRVGAIGDADGVRRADRRGELALERRALAAEQEPAAVEHAGRSRRRARRDRPQRRARGPRRRPPSSGGAYPRPRRPHAYVGLPNDEIVESSASRPVRPDLICMR